MIGVAINAGGILIGGMFGLAKKQPLSAANESLLKVALAVATITVGLQLTWKNINGSFGGVMKQLFIVLLSMSLGKLIGRLLHLQKLSNSIGKFATNKLS